MVKDWFDVIRMATFYRLAMQWKDQDTWNENLFPGIVTRRLIFQPPRTFHHPMGIVTEYNSVYKIAKKGHPHYPDMFSVRGDSFGVFAEDTRRYKFGSLAFFWAHAKQDVITFEGEAIDKGFPSVVEIKNGAAFFTKDDVLTDFDGHPAFKARYIFATWTTPEGDKFRPDGPRCVAFRNYSEHWKDGENQGYEVDRGHPLLEWHDYQKEDDARLLFAAGSKGEINPWGNEFFTTAEDSFNYMTEFGLE